MQGKSRFIILIMWLTLALLTHPFLGNSGGRDMETPLFVNPELSTKVKKTSKPYSREEIRNARPIGLAQSGNSSVKEQTSDLFPETPYESDIITIPSGQPDTNADREARETFPDQWALLKEQLRASISADEESQRVTESSVSGDTAESAISPADHPFSAYWGNYWSAQHLNFPWKAVGKLTFRDGSTTYRGTARVIYGPNGNLIVTAAHNVEPRY
jgi:hypothetical protein